MNKHLKVLITAMSVAVGSTGAAFAEGGDGSGGGAGDNSMSRWTGESYKAFDEARKGTPTLNVADAPKGKAGRVTAACDNGMSQWCGDSFTALRPGIVGDFYTGRDQFAHPGEGIGDRARQIAAAPRQGWQVGRAFRDDTAG